MKKYQEQITKLPTVIWERDQLPNQTGLSNPIANDSGEMREVPRPAVESPRKDSKIAKNTVT